MSAAIELCTYVKTENMLHFKVLNLKEKVPSKAFTVRVYFRQPKFYTLRFTEYGARGVQISKFQSNFQKLKVLDFQNNGFITKFREY